MIQPLAQGSCVDFQITSSSEPSPTSFPNHSPFTYTSSLPSSSAFTTPRATPHYNFLEFDAATQGDEKLPVKLDEQNEAQPFIQPLQVRPYPPEMYSQQPGYATASYANPTGVLPYPPGMLHPAVVMGPIQSPPDIYAPQRHREHAVPQLPYITPAPKRKCSVTNDGAAKPKRSKNARPPVNTDEDFIRVVSDSNGGVLYECQVPQCKRLRMKEASVYHHRLSSRHSQSKNLVHCTFCGESLSRSDSLKRHIKARRCLLNQENNIRKGLTACGNTPTASGTQGVAPHWAPQQASVSPPPPVIASGLSITTSYAAKDDDNGPFISPEMSALPPNLALSLPVAAQEGTANAPAADFTPGFDASVLDVSYDEWFSQAEQATAAAVYAGSTMDFCAF